MVLCTIHQDMCVHSVLTNNINTLALIICKGMFAEDSDQDCLDATPF